MVKITSYQLRKSEGREFFALILESGIEIVKSSNGKFYASTKKVSIPCPFSEETCKALLGEQMKGSIRSVQCDPYSFIVPETGEELIRDTHYEYFPEEIALDFAEDLEKSSNLKLNGQLI